jgi:hypothetical protein
MSKLKAHVKALPFFWTVKKVNAVRKFSQALSVLDPVEDAPSSLSDLGIQKSD